jgi:hypothetical protein
VTSSNRTFEPKRMETLSTEITIYHHNIRALDYGRISEGSHDFHA